MRCANRVLGDGERDAQPPHRAMPDSGDNRNVRLPAGTGSLAGSQFSRLVFAARPISSVLAMMRTLYQIPPLAS